MEFSNITSKDNERESKKIWIKLYYYEFSFF